jgi:hypothetical protein
MKDQYKVLGELHSLQLTLTEMENDIKACLFLPDNTRVQTRIELMRDAATRLISGIEKLKAAVDAP